MKTACSAILALAVLAIAAPGLLGGAARAQTVETRLVNQCVDDSAGMAASTQVKIMYCTCMVSQMGSNETRSVTQFEQARPALAADCARRAGWK